MTKLFMALALSIAAVTAISGASGQDVGERSTVIVHFGDLDLRNAADVHTLTNRIRSAVGHVCDVYPRTSAIPVIQDRCRATTMRKLAPTVDRTIAMATNGTNVAMMSASVPAH